MDQVKAVQILSLKNKNWREMIAFTRSVCLLFLDIYAGSFFFKH